MNPKDVRGDSHLYAVRGAGILLVIFGHLIEKPAAGSQLLQVVYIGIYSFHMPLFVFLSGLFAREVLTVQDYRKMVWTLVLPLVLFQLIYIGMSRLTGWYEYSLLTPYWILWFIVSLICWRLLLPLFASPLGLLVAAAGSLVAGYDSDVGYALSASRTIYFLPYFVLGHLYGAQLVAVARRRPVLFACLFAIVMTAVLLWWKHGLNAGALTGSRDYATGAADASYPASARLAVMLLGLTAMLGFAALVPRSSAVLRWLGERSLSVYLLHGLVVMALVGFGVVDMIPSPLLLPVLALLTVVVGLAAASADGFMRLVFSPPIPKPAG